MGRAKLELKRIENTTNRQVTFSKRRNGLIKKAYELSVLCDVDVALLTFSPSGRLSFFSGTKSIEEILSRYMNLPEHERGRLHNPELMQKTVAELQLAAAISDHQTANGGDAASSRDQNPTQRQFQEFEQGISRLRIQMVDVQKQLRIFEGNIPEITSLRECEYQEEILNETLKRVLLRKQVLEEKLASNSTRPQNRHHHQVCWTWNTGSLAHNSKSSTSWVQIPLSHSQEQPMHANDRTTPSLCVEDEDINSCDDWPHEFGNAEMPREDHHHPLNSS